MRKTPDALRLEAASRTGGQDLANEEQNEKGVHRLGNHEVDAIQGTPATERHCGGRLKFLGIDPGHSGGLALVSSDSAQAWKMPESELGTATLLRELLPQIHLAMLEAVTPMGIGRDSKVKQGLGSTWKFGQHYGFLRGLLQGLNIPFATVRPQVWQPALGIEKRGTKSGTEHKNATKDRAQSLWPEIKMTHAIADALLIAEFARKIFIR